MLRLLNVIAIVVLVGSAVYAYSIKYSTLYQAEKTGQAEARIADRDRLARDGARRMGAMSPIRCAIEALADQYLGGQVMQLSQIATLASLPDKGRGGDEIGAKLQDLGLAESTSTPGAAKGVRHARRRRPRCRGQARRRRHGRGDEPCLGPSARIEPEFAPACPAPAHEAFDATGAVQCAAGLPAGGADRGGARRGAGLRAGARAPPAPPRRRFELKKAFCAQSSRPICRKAAAASGSTAIGLRRALSAVRRPAGLSRTKPDPAFRAARGLARRSPPRGRNSPIATAQLLATDVKVMSVFAEPRDIIDKDEATEDDHRHPAGRQRPGLARSSLGSRKGFVWIKRDVSPAAAAGDFPPRPARRRLPAGKQARLSRTARSAPMCSASPIPTITASPGIEKYLDGQGLSDLHDAGFKLTPENLAPVALSLDMRATHAVRDELVQACSAFRPRPPPRRSWT